MAIDAVDQSIAIGRVGWSLARIHDVPTHRAQVNVECVSRIIFHSGKFFTQGLQADAGVSACDDGNFAGQIDTLKYLPRSSRRPETGGIAACLVGTFNAPFLIGWLLRDQTV
jgi:hypothetical protein